MSQPPDQARSPADLRWYLAIARRHKLLIALVAGLTVAATAVFTIQQTPLYTSEGKVLVKDVGVNNAYYKPVSADMPTERALASSETVARQVKQDINSPEPAADLLSGLTVTVEQDATVLDFDYTATSPRLSQQLAQAFANGYIEYRNQAATKVMQQQMQPLQDELGQLNHDIPKLEASISKTDVTDTSYAGMSAQLTNDMSRASYLTQQLVPFKQALTTVDGGDIVQDAPLPTSPSSPDLGRSLLLAIIVGLILGIGAALVRERLDDRLRGGRDLDERIGAPILATVPRVPGWKRRSNTVLIARTAPKGAIAESYRTLRTNLQFLAKDQRLQVLAVTSPTAGQGKTTTVANLAVTLAQAGLRVIAVSCDLRKPRLHHFFDLGNSTGLSDLLAGRLSLPRSSAQPFDIDLLRVIASGPTPSNPAELLNSQAMHDLLGELRRYADFVLLDLPPVLAVSDPMVVAPMADGVLIVADANLTSKGAASHTREQLELVGAKIVGCVLNNFSPQQAAYYPYDNNFYYGAYGYAELNSPSDPVESATGSNGQLRAPEGTSNL